VGPHRTPLRFKAEGDLKAGRGKRCRKLHDERTREQRPDFRYLQADIAALEAMRSPKRHCPLKPEDPRGADRKRQERRAAGNAKNRLGGPARADMKPVKALDEIKDDAGGGYTFSTRLSQIAGRPWPPWPGIRPKPVAGPRRTDNH